MNTPSHLIINGAIEKKLGAKFKLAKSAFLWGSVLPDLPFALLVWGTYAYYQFVLQQDLSGVMENIIHVAYFDNPWWISAHNFQHSPTALILYVILLWRFVGKIGTRGHWWLSYVFGNMIHSGIDVLTHATDGPVLFWPIDWQFRFSSPVSYWDKAHYANQFVYFEIGLDLVLLAYLFLPKIIKRFSKQ